MKAIEGHVAVVVRCRCQEATLVLASRVERWSCPACHGKARPTGERWVLGPGGALPAGYRPSVAKKAAA